MAGAGPSPFYSLQDLQAAQDAPGGLDPSDPNVAFDTQAAQPVPDIDAQYAAAANAWQQAAGPEPAQTAFAQAPEPPAAEPADPYAPYAGMPAPMPPQPPPTLADRMQMYQQMALAQYGRFKQPLREASPVGLLRNILTGGAQAHANAVQAERENIKIAHDNAAIDMRAMDAARAMWAADSTREMAELRLGLSQINTQLDVLRFHSEQGSREFQRARQAYEDKRQQYIDALEGRAPETAPPMGAPPGTPPTSYAPPAPGSPLAGGPTGAAAAPSAATTASRRPGESLYDWSQRRKVESAGQVAAARAAVPTSTTRTMAETAPKILDLVQQVEDDLTRVQPGPLASRYKEFMTGTVGVADPAWTSYRTNVGLLTTLLLRMHVGARGGQQMMEHFKGLLNQGRQSPENMKAALEEIRTYAESVSSHGGPPEGTWQGTQQPTTPTAGAPTTTTMPAPTGGAGYATTPSGRRYRIVQ